jgi:hypothetical protein
MNEQTEKTLIIALIIAIAILGINLLTGNPLIGFISATPSPTADANVTIISAASIIVTQDDVNLGTLYVLDSNTSCGTSSTCQLGSTSQVTTGRGIVFENNGSIDVNVTAQSSAFFTGTGTIPNDGNKLGCKASWNESSASIAQFWAQSWWNCYNGTTPKIVGCLSKTESGDSVRVDFNVTIPPDEPAGLKQATVTLTATAC